MGFLTALQIAIPTDFYSLLWILIVIFIIGIIIIVVLGFLFAFPIALLAALLVWVLTGGLSGGGGPILNGSDVPCGSDNLSDSWQSLACFIQNRP